jgi:hypothetical protein
LDAAPTINISQLAINNTSGEIYAVRGGSQESKAISYIKYSLTTRNKDWISNYNTMIPADNYSVVFVGSSFKTQTTDDGLKPSVPPSNGATYVYAFINSAANTWSLTADYIGN